MIYAAVNFTATIAADDKEISIYRNFILLICHYTFGNVDAVETIDKII